MATNLPAGKKLMGKYGPGTDGNRPKVGKACIVTNNRSKTMFIPDNSTAERTSVYNSSFSDRGSGASYLINYGNYARLYSNTSTMGNGPCWNGNNGDLNYKTPAACPSGYTSEINPNINDGYARHSFSGNTKSPTSNPNAWKNHDIGANAIHHQNPSWVFYNDRDYGCGTNYSIGRISIRYCYKQISTTNDYNNGYSPGPVRSTAWQKTY